MMTPEQIATAAMTGLAPGYPIDPEVVKEMIATVIEADRERLTRGPNGHVVEARRNIEGLHDYQSEEGITEASMMTVAIEAQVHATLALVEQQRIANILAAAHLEADVFEHEKMLDIREALAL